MLLPQRVQQGSYVTAANNSTRQLIYCRKEFSKAFMLLRQTIQQGSYVTAANNSARQLCYCRKEFSKAVVSTRWQIT